jgi:hypothetical protein
MPAPQKAVCSSPSTGATLVPLDEDAYQAAQEQELGINEHRHHHHYYYHHHHHHHCRHHDEGEDEFISFHMVLSRR